MDLPLTGVTGVRGASDQDATQVGLFAPRVGIRKAPARPVGVRTPVATQAEAPAAAPATTQPVSEPSQPAAPQVPAADASAQRSFYVSPAAQRALTPQSAPPASGQAPAGLSLAQLLEQPLPGLQGPPNPPGWTYAFPYSMAAPTMQQMFSDAMAGYKAHGLTLTPGTPLPPAPSMASQLGWMAGQTPSQIWSGAAQRFGSDFGGIQASLGGAPKG